MFCLSWIIPHYFDFIYLKLVYCGLENSGNRKSFEIRCYIILFQPVYCVIETKGGQLVSGSLDNTLRVWDLSKGIGRECVEVLYPIEAGVSITGLDFSRASFPEDPSAALPTMLWQNGATIPGKKSSIRSELSTD